MNNTRKKNFLINFAYCFSIVLLIYFIVKFIFPLFSPFIIGLALSLIFYPLTMKLFTLKCGRTTAALIITSAIFIGAGSAVFFIAKGIFTELYEFAEKIIDDPNIILSPIVSFIDGINSKHPAFSQIIDISSVYSFLSDRLKLIAGSVLESGANIAISIPDYIFFLFTLISSTFYLVKYSGGYSAFLCEILSKDKMKMLRQMKKHFSDYSKNYLILTLLLLGTTFIQLLIGFLILGINYAIVLSLIIALIDMLPVFGVGTVLIPWCLIEALGGNTTRCIGLLIIYLIVTIFRSVVEHKMLSKRFDMPPLLTLISIFCGYKLLGFLGLIISPFISSLLFVLLKQKIENESNSES